ncbi:hypothetical protein F2P81_014954 [Scophthalmus maximus]|uniref:Uncharacterized protein n=1 Tax=Scophthalmus maximus TaxID=52904 RepID=A0A6A4SNI3_SCOMX|nr:hypothetical protein F2P81_014954 [Scophthalmus maximus]
MLPSTGECCCRKCPPELTLLHIRCPWRFPHWLTRTVRSPSSTPCGGLSSKSNPRRLHLRKKIRSSSPLSLSLTNVALPRMRRCAGPMPPTLPRR